MVRGWWIPCSLSTGTYAFPIDDANRSRAVPGDL